MICPEYKAWVEGGVPLANMTRAERCAIRNHYQGCPDCQSWLADVAARERIDLGDTSPEVAALLAVDYQDPEAT